MSLLHDIQASVLKEDVSLASVLLKLRLLNSHLESEPLATWIRQELEGYGADEVPPYRTVGVTYKGTFSSPVSRMKNAPIPPALINKFAGEHFTHYKMKHSVSAITMLAQTDGARVDGSDLILLLQGKVYADYRCNDVFGIVSPTDFVGILDVVRSKILDFTIAIEKEHPDIREVDLSRKAPESSGGLTANANRIFQQIVYANNVTNSVISFEADLERILADRVRRSGSNEGERERIIKSIKSVGIQEVVKQIVQKAPDLLRLLSTLGQ